MINNVCIAKTKIYDAQIVRLKLLPYFTDWMGQLLARGAVVATYRHNCYLVLDLPRH